MPDNVQLVVDRIDRAFAEVSLGNGVSLREADVMDGYGTPTERTMARGHDEAKDWRRIPDELISKYDWCLSFFDAKGMRFYLPAYMRFALLNYRESASASINATIFTLGHAGEQFSLLTSPQRAAVRQFLKFMAFNGGNYVDSGSARRALEDVWMKPKPRSA